MSDLKDRLASAIKVVREIESTPDGGIPDFIVGASYGQGVVTCRTPKGWSGPVFVRLAGASFGFQIGGQATDLVLISVNDKGFEDLLHSKFKIGADASAAADPVGRHAAAATDILLNPNCSPTYVRRGVFAGVDLNGAVVSQNTDDTNLFYGGQAKPYAEILHRAVSVPRAARQFVSTIARYFHSTR